MSVRSHGWIVVLAVVSLLFGSQARGQGIVIPGAGPINRSMAGTGVAAPLDVAGALYNNPAQITGLQSSEFVMGLDFLQVSTHLASSFMAGPIGETRSDSGVAALPTMAVAFQSDDSPVTLGVGLFSIGGFGVNYPETPTNPILTTPDGVGPIFSRLNVYQVLAAAAMKLTDRLSIGFSPTVVISEAALDPDIFATPAAGA